MKRLKDFDYHEPATLDEAVVILEEAPGDARVLAGGTDLIVDMKIERLQPSTVVNLKRIPGLTGVDLVAGGIRIGALTKVTDVEESVIVQSRYEALGTAASLLASPPVRALATIGGNVGRASPASDLGPALIVSSAVAHITGVTGSREELVEDLYAGPGETTLAPSDIITHFFLPDPPTGYGSAHVKLGKRGSGTDIAMAGTSASVVVADDGAVAECKVALASLGPIPMRASHCENALRGRVPDADVLAAAAAAAAEDASPIGDMRASADYRTTLARVLTLRALRGAVAAAGAEVGVR
ncbi:MAG: xanthine dehydrogenase family protein subunit M [Acidimicrobiia bacterium]|nr:xanthine dehydrogenase family protein subunit M [Acidimicrobiia bacterium]